MKATSIGGSDKLATIIQETLEELTKDMDYYEFNLIGTPETNEQGKPKIVSLSIVLKLKGEEDPADNLLKGE